MAKIPDVVIEYKPVVVEISKLELKPGQILIIQFPTQASEYEIRKMADSLRPYIPDGVPVMLLRGVEKITVVERKND